MVLRAAEYSGSNVRVDREGEAGAGHRTCACRGLPCRNWRQSLDARGVFLVR